MKPLLLTDYGLCLKTKERRLVLLNQDSGERREWLPVEFPYDSIIVENLGGFVTFPALRWLALNGVSLTALDFNGRVLASYLPDWPLNPNARLAQMAAYLNPASRLEVARFILAAKLGKPVPATYRTWDDLLTYEGRQAEAYWRDLGITRDYPSARDPTNACLNYSFGLLASRARAAIHRLSLEPSIGFLHTPQSYKQALVYDCVEPFRASTVKTALAVKQELNSRQFGEVYGHGLRLRPEGAHRLVESFAKAFPEKEMGRFVERLALRCAALGRAAQSRQEPRASGPTAPPLFA
ncbi:MAG: CRISPR-associated endonuclease Cas1 [Thermoplasmata archaeon]|nr:CRISPR-associated endonuclease Cas1 [Thermoplasmata archaeon]